MKKYLRTLLIFLVVVGGVALMGVRNVRAKMARHRIWAASVHWTIRGATGVALCARAGGVVSSPMVQRWYEFV